MELSASDTQVKAVNFKKTHARAHMYTHTHSSQKEQFSSTPKASRLLGISCRFIERAP